MLLGIDAQHDHDQVATELARWWVLNSEGGIGEWLLPDVDGVGAKAQVREGDDRAR